MKINFTQQHYERMLSLLIGMLITNDTIDNKLGQPLNVVELLHTTTINSLNTIKMFIGKQIEQLENQDEWVSSDVTQKNLDRLKNHKELVNLIVGYKRYKLEAEEIAKKKNELAAKIDKIKEETKTPEDKLKEAEAELAALESTDF